MSQPIDLLIKNGSCFIDNNLKKVDLAISDSKIQEIGEEYYRIVNVREVSWTGEIQGVED